MPDIEMDGFRFVVTFVAAPGGETGAGMLYGPDGRPAGIEWEQSESAFIMRVGRPAGEGWGAYRVGFRHPVSGPADLRANLAELIGRLRILHERARLVH